MKKMIYGYVRGSTQEQSLESQKNLISRYSIKHKLMVDEWIAVEMSSKKSQEARRIDQLLNKLQPHDIVIASELSRLGRSIKETLNTIDILIHKKQTRLILIKQNLDMDPHNKNNFTNKVLITVFSMIAELERDFISERTKEGLKARKERGIILGKPKGTLQSSMYNPGKEKIFHLYQLDVPLTKIIHTHLGYGPGTKDRVKKCKVRRSTELKNVFRS